MLGSLLPKGNKKKGLFGVGTNIEYSRIKQLYSVFYVLYRARINRHSYICTKEGTTYRYITSGTLVGVVGFSRDFVLTKIYNKFSVNSLGAFIA